MRFFTPLPAFYAWAQNNLKRSHVFDVGGGEGHIADALAVRGIRITSLDLFIPDLLAGNAMYADGTIFPYPPGTTVMMCRPCHGLFPEMVVSRAVHCGAAQIIYVGLTKNFKKDLGKYHKNFQVVLEAAGENDEKVWRWQLVEEDGPLNNVAFVQAEYWSKPVWVIDRGRYWEYVSGGRTPKRDSDKVTKTATMVEYDFPSLDWTGSLYDRPDSECGWLSPEGVFYGCEYEDHDNTAYLVIKKSVRDLENEGWARIDKKDGRFPYSFRGAYNPTPVQAAWLVAHGHDLDPFKLKGGGNLTDPERDKLAAEASLSTARQNPEMRLRLPREGD